MKIQICTDRLNSHAHFSSEQALSQQVFGQAAALPVDVGWFMLMTITSATMEKESIIHRITTSNFSNDTGPTSTPP
jgi:hypothetical protein